MANTKANQITIPIEYTRAADYRVVHAAGAWGGATPQGEVECAFFVDCRRLGKSKMVILDERTGRAEERPPTTQGLTRELQVGVVMSPAIARSVGKWLLAKAEDATGNRKDEVDG